MANEQNLRPGNPATRFHAGEGNGRGAVENGRKSGEARRRKADLRRMAQEVLDGTYKAKNGEEITGGEMLIRGLVANLADPKGKNWAKAIDYIIQLTGAQRTAEQRRREELEIEILKTKLQQIQGGGDEASGKLADLIDGLKEPFDDIHEETATANAVVAEQSSQANQSS